MYSDFISPEAETWTEILADMKHDFYHLPQYVRLCAEHEKGEPLAFVAGEDGNRFLLPLIVRSASVDDGRMTGLFDATSPYGYAGPLWETEDGGLPSGDFVGHVLASLKEALRKRRIISLFVRLHPLFDLPLDSLTTHGRLVQHGETVLVDLTLSEDEIWRQTRADHRRGINRSKRADFLVEMDPSWSALHDFIQVYTETMQRVNATSHYFFSRNYFDRIKEEMHDVFHLATVCIDGVVAAAGLFSEVCGIVQFHLSGTGNRFVRLYPSKIMLDFVRNWAKQRGNKVFHLGGGFGAAADSLFEFKAGFSKLRKPFFTWRAIADEAAYNKLTERWEDQAGVKAEDPDGFFPAYRKPLQNPSH